MDKKQLDSEWILNTYKRFPILITHGNGSYVYDENGKEYIDLASGIAVNSFGISDDEWKNAVIEQLNKVQHTSNLYYSEPQIELAEMLCKRTGMKKVFFSNSGAEANECAIKTARKYANDKYDGKRQNIITLINSFHGRTVTTLSATGQDGMHTNFAPFTEGFRYVPANDIEALKQEIQKGDVAAVMLEMVQGEGGVKALEKEYVQSAAKLAEENDVLLIVDEVQTGNGRTGKLYSYMHHGITPDIVTTAKGLAGGLPLGATLFSEKTCNVLTAGLHGSTFGGNPICAAGAVNILSRIDDALMAEVSKKGKYVKDELLKVNGVKSVSGMGLMIGIETEKPASDIVAKCLENGVLVITAKTKVRLLPALNIPMDTLKKAVEIIKNAIEK